MPVDRDRPVQLFALVPKLVADVEPVPRELDHLLDDEEIVHRITTDPARRAPHSPDGRRIRARARIR